MPTMEKDDRTYDPDGFRRRAACLCYRDASQQEVLLVSSLRHRGQWVVPGGGVEKDESIRDAGQRELWEEAGVRGRIIDYLGVFEDSGSRPHRTHVFSVQLESEVETFKEEELGRRRRWFTIDDAKRQLQMSKPFQCSYFGGCSADVPSPPRRQHRQFEVTANGQR